MELWKRGGKNRTDHTVRLWYQQMPITTKLDDETEQLELK